MTASSDEGHDGQGVSYSDYPDCEHGDIEPGTRCTTYVPSAVKQQRLIDRDPEGHERDVEVMLDAVESRHTELGGPKQ